MNEQQRREQFAAEARAFFTNLHGHADLREREELATFLRTFAEHVVEETLQATIRRGDVLLLTDQIAPLPEMRAAHE